MCASGDIRQYFCSDTLPAIQHQIECLKVASTLMERILLAADYPNLSQLDIFIPHEKPILHFNGEYKHWHCHPYVEDCSGKDRTLPWSLESK